LENIQQGLELLAVQGNAEGFINNTNNADNLNGLVGDIHNAVMDYQVGSQSKPSILMPDICLRHHCSKISMKKVVRLL